MNHKPHRFATLFPRADAADTATIRNDILKNGCRVPIVLYEGKILDGWTRYTICDQHNVKPFFREFHGNDKEALSHVMSLNLCRRHLTQAQKAAIAVDLKHELLKQGATLTESLAEAALIAKVGSRSVQRMERVQAESKKVADKVRNGRLSISEAERVLNTPTDSEEARRLLLQAKATLRRALFLMGEAPQRVVNDMRLVISTLDIVIKRHEDW